MLDKQSAALTKANRDELATRLLVFLSGRQEDLERLFAVCGVDPSMLRSHMSDPGFQQGLLDYVMANEPLLLAFCEETGEDPAQFARWAHSGQRGREEGDQAGDEGADDWA